MWGHTYPIFVGAYGGVYEDSIFYEAFLPPQEHHIERGVPSR